MDKKDWSFLKQCRKEKNLTQEQLAEKVSECLQEQFPDGKQEQICQISVYLLSLLNITMLK